MDITAHNGNNFREIYLIECFFVLQSHTNPSWIFLNAEIKDVSRCTEHVFFFYRKPATTKFRNFNDEIEQDWAPSIIDFGDKFYSMCSKTANFKNK